MNYFVFVVTRTCTQVTESFGYKETHSYLKGDTGVGKISCAPSIGEFPKIEPCGLMYVAPGAWVQEQAIDRGWSPLNMSPDQIKTLVLGYWRN